MNPQEYERFADKSSSAQEHERKTRENQHKSNSSAEAGSSGCFLLLFILLFFIGSVLEQCGSDKKTRTQRRQQFQDELDSRPRPNPGEKASIDTSLYPKLENYLSQQQWKNADQETRNVMLKIADRKDEEWLDTESISYFPCKDLQNIDKLWVKHSNGKFGFSVQKKIYDSTAGNTRKYSRRVWEKFADKIGWRQGGSFINYRNVTFDLDTAYAGHIPIVGSWRWTEVRDLFYRIETCRDKL